MASALQWLIIGKPISQYTSYAAMFCPLHRSISIEQHEKHLYTIHPAITENMEDSLVKQAPHILMSESHNASISAMSISFHNIINVRSVSVIFLSPISANCKSSPIHSCEERMGAQWVQR